MHKIIKNINLFIVLFIFTFSPLLASDIEFDSWLKNFKEKAISSGISKNVVNEVMSEARFLPKVIEYDRYQPEFYEDTFTYIKKRTNSKKVKKGKALYKKEKFIIDKIDKKF